MTTWICPRSVLFTPASEPEKIEKALRLQADAICIDLEDGVAAGDKASARAYIANALPARKENRPHIWVRINAELTAIAADIASLPDGVEAIVAPKIRGFSHIELVTEALAARYVHSNQMPRIIPMVESMEALDRLNRNLPVISENLCALAFGAEDFSADLGVSPDCEGLKFSFHDLMKVSKRIGVPLLGYPGAISNFNDMTRLSDDLTLARKIGASGAFCIHPKQISILNNIFSATPEELNWAKKVIETLEQHTEQNRAIFVVDGQMVDEPIIKRAKQILKRNIIENF